MRSTSDGPIIVLGAGGWAGGTHARIHANAGRIVWRVDPAHAWSVTPPTEVWREAIVDVCTPTATHGRAVVEAYLRGARRFIVEKPQETSLDAWQRLLAKLPAAKILSVHNYVWSEAFERAVDAVGDVVEIECAFDKDRLLDDRRGRGAHDGRLAHVLHVEAPHQFSLAMDLCPGLRVVTTDVRDDRVIATTTGASSAYAAVELAAPDGVRARLTTDLRAQKRRSLRLVGARGQVAKVDFAPSGLEPATVHVGRVGGPLRLRWAGADDALGNNLRGAVRAFDDEQRIPARLAPAFTSRVLGCLEASMAEAVAHAA